MLWIVVEGAGAACDWDWPLPLSTVLEMNDLMISRLAFNSIIVGIFQPTSLTIVDLNRPQRLGWLPKNETTGNYK